MQRPERHGTPRNVVWLDTSNLDIVLRRRRTPRHFSGRCVSESVERLCPSQWFLRSKGGLYQCPRSWIGSVKLEKNFVSVKKQGFFFESMVSEVCAVGQRNIRFIRMFMSVAEVKETFGKVWEEGLFQCQRKIYVSYLWMSSWLWLSLARNEFDMSVEFKHITYVNVYMYVYNVALLSYLSVCLSVEQVPLRCVPDQWLWRWDDVSPREWRTLLRSIHPYEGGSGNSPQKVKHSGAGVKAILKDKSRNTGKATHRYLCTTFGQTISLPLFFL